mgnify:CR=1 FL=1
MIGMRPRGRLSCWILGSLGGMPYRHGAIGLSTVASAGRKEQFILLEIGLSTVSKGQWW